MMSPYSKELFLWNHKHLKVVILAPLLCLTATLAFPVEGYVFLLLSEIQKEHTKMKIMMVIYLFYLRGDLIFIMHYKA